MSMVPQTFFLLVTRKTTQICPLIRGLVDIGPVVENLKVLSNQIFAQNTLFFHF